VKKKIELFGLVGQKPLVLMCRRRRETKSSSVGELEVQKRRGGDDGGLVSRMKLGARQLNKPGGTAEKSAEKSKCKSIVGKMPFSNDNRLALSLGKLLPVGPTKRLAPPQWEGGGKDRGTKITYESVPAR